MPNAFKFYSDPSHGWLEVPRKLAAQVGVLDQITPYSHQKGANLYLEEDCDANRFVQAYEAKFGPIKTVAINSNTASIVRKYPSFRR